MRSVLLVTFQVSGMVLGGLFIAMRTRRAGFEVEWRRFALGLALVIAAGIAGSRVGFLLSDPGYYVAHWREAFSLQATIIQGGLIFGFLAAIWFARFLHIPFGRLLDLMAPGLALAQGIGRFGCLSYGCCAGLSIQPAILGLTHYPTQLMHAGANFLICLVLLLLERRGVSPFEGFLFLAYAFLFSTQRLLIDFARAAGAVFADGTILAGVRVARVLGAATIFVAIGIAAWKLFVRDGK